MDVKSFIYGLVTIFAAVIFRALNGLIFKAQLIPVFNNIINGSLSNIEVDTQVAIAGSYNFIYHAINSVMYAIIFCVVVYWVFQAFKKERGEEIY